MKNYIIESLLAEHRKKALITCEEGCFCWSIERVLIAEEAAQQNAWKIWKIFRHKCVSCEKSISGDVYCCDCVEEIAANH